MASVPGIGHPNLRVAGSHKPTSHAVLEFTKGAEESQVKLYTPTHICMHMYTDSVFSNIEQIGRVYLDTGSRGCTPKMHMYDSTMHTHEDTFFKLRLCI